MSAEQPDFEFETILPHVHRVEVLRVPYPLCAGEGHKLYYRPGALASECERALCHALLPDDAGGELYWHPHALAPCVRPFGWLPAGLPA